MPSEAEILAKKIFGPKKIKKIEQTGSEFVRRYKVIVFVPPDKTEELIFSMASAGAGNIGNYTLCSFRTPGKGSFMGNPDSAPSIGSKGKFETVEEDRLEMVCDKENLDNVIDKLYKVHPYDEPAFEIYEVLSRTKQHDKDIIRVTFKEKTSARKLLKIVNPDIIMSNVPEKIKKIKVLRSVIDCSESNELYTSDLEDKILYIKRENKNLKAYLI